MVLATYHSGAQENKLNWSAYIKEITDSADNDQYLYLYYTRGGKKQKIFYCLQYKNEQLLTINIGDTLFREAVIKHPDLFKYVSDHIKYFKAVRHHNPKAYSKAKFRRDIQNPEVSFMQLGIKNKDLHYNHFQRTSPEFIASLNKKKYKVGYSAINMIIDIIEKSAIQSLAEKN